MSLNNQNSNEEECVISSTVTLREQIGIDKTVFTGFRIIHIDNEKLMSHKNVEFEQQGKLLYLLKDGSGFRWLKIKDNFYFGTLVAGTRNTKFMKKDYGRIDTYIRDAEQGNLQNYTVKEYKNKVQQILQYIEVEYGIQIDDSHISLNELEINCTFQLKHEFHKYHRVLRLLMYNLPKPFKKLVEYGKADKINNRILSETFLRGNDSTTVKIYDKKEQLHQKIGLIPEGNIMRIEWVLKKPAKIKAVFGTNYLSELTEEKINNFYIEQFAKNIENRYEKWKKENSKLLKQMIIEHKQKSSRQWKSNLLKECCNNEQKNQVPVLLDISDLLAEVKRLDNSGHFSRDKRELLRQCKYNDVFLQNDTEKVKEIISKVHGAYGFYLQSTTCKERPGMPINGETV